jgi:hypothetical protein
VSRRKRASYRGHEVSRRKRARIRDGQGHSIIDTCPPLEGYRVQVLNTEGDTDVKSVLRRQGGTDVGSVSLAFLKEVLPLKETIYI